VTVVGIQVLILRLLRSKYVAHILDCSADDVIELACRGKLKSRKEGRFWRFKEADVLAYKRKNGF